MEGRRSFNCLRLSRARLCRWELLSYSRYSVVMILNYSRALSEIQFHRIHDHHQQMLEFFEQNRLKIEMRDPRDSNPMNIIIIFAMLISLNVLILSSLVCDFSARLSLFFFSLKRVTTSGTKMCIKSRHSLAVGLFWRDKIDEKAHELARETPTKHFNCLRRGRASGTWVM